MATTTALAILAALATGAADEPRAASPEVFRQACERWGERLVPVEIWLRRSEGEDPSRSFHIRHFTTGSKGFGPLGPSMGMEYHDKRPMELPGLAVDPRSVWIPDPGIERRFIERVAVGRPGRPATILGAFLRVPGWVLRPQEPIDVSPIEFTHSEGLAGVQGLGSSFHQGDWVLEMTPALGGYRSLGGAIWAEVPPVSLLLDRELRPVGFTFSTRAGLEGAPDLWRGKEISGGPLLEFEAFDRGREEISGRLSSSVLTVRGFYRREEEAEGHGQRFRFRRGDDEGAGNDFHASGFLVGPRRVLVHHGLHRETALRLERVVVMAAGEERPARFVGAFRRYHAFLVELEGGPDLPQPLDLSASPRLAASQPLIAYAADHSTGRRREFVDLNRIADFEPGYRRVLEPILQRFPRPASLLIGAEDHSLQALVLEVKREADDDSGRSFRGRGEIDLRVMSLADLRQLLQEGEAAFDRRLSPRPAEREKDMVWLGVDFQPISRELARSHGVEIPTRGGEIGLIVLAVTPGSPAERAGIAPGDILLSFREMDEPEPWEISAQGDFGRDEPLEIPEDIPEEIREEFMAEMGPPWRSPRNFLNEKLTRIGEGREVEVASLRQGSPRSCRLTLEIGPPDFENARKHVFEDLGLTVKDLTYEVRGHYRLKADAPGVVVAKVEPGSKAAIAKVPPFEILVSVNGQQVRDVEALVKAVEEASRADGGGATLELKLEKMGKSRLVRIRL